MGSVEEFEGSSPVWKHPSWKQNHYADHIITLIYFHQDVWPRACHSASLAQFKICHDMNFTKTGLGMHELDKQHHRRVTITYVNGNRTWYLHLASSSTIYFYQFLLDTYSLCSVNNNDIYAYVQSFSLSKSSIEIECFCLCAVNIFGGIFLSIHHNLNTIKLQM